MRGAAIAKLWRRGLLVVLVLLSLTAVVTRQIWYRSRYPYGWSHCCDLQLLNALEDYAADHGGAFPTDEPTPEASLSLLYPNYADANLLRGKTVPEEVVQGILDRGKRLRPDTCGWHYVEGLTQNDDSRLAIFWDTVGLGHNGERLPPGGHWVMRFHHQREYIAGSDWEAFLQEQNRLLAERRAKK
jgi:hypothetical protein